MGLVNAWKGFFTSNQDIFEQKPVKKRRRSYTGARVDRLSASWVTNQTSADQEWKQGIVKLRSNVHDLVRNNNYAAQAIRYSTNQVVGTGVRLQAQIRKQRNNEHLGTQRSPTRSQMVTKTNLKSRQNRVLPVSAKSVILNTPPTRNPCF